MEVKINQKYPTSYYSIPFHHSSPPFHSTESRCPHIPTFSLFFLLNNFGMVSLVYYVFITSIVIFLTTKVCLFFFSVFLLSFLI